MVDKGRDLSLNEFKEWESKVDCEEKSADDGFREGEAKTREIFGEVFGFEDDDGN